MQDSYGAIRLVSEGPPGGTGVCSQLLEALQVFLEELRGQNEEDPAGAVAWDGDVYELHITISDVCKCLGAWALLLVVSGSWEGHLHEKSLHCPTPEILSFLDTW